MNISKIYLLYIFGGKVDILAHSQARARTKSYVAYEQLRKAVITFEIESGEPLDETLLMEQLGVGRTPLREALKRLAVEGLLIAPAHSTPYVRPVSMDELRSLYETRLLMEVRVCAKAADRITDTELASLGELIASIDAAVATGDVYKAVELDYTFHTAVATATKNRFLAEAINQLNRSSLRLWYLAHLRLGLSTVVEMHASILDALQRRQPRIAAEAMHHHIIDSRNRVAAALLSGAEDSIDIEDWAGHDVSELNANPNNGGETLKRDNHDTNTQRGAVEKPPTKEGG